MENNPQPFEIIVRHHRSRLIDSLRASVQDAFDGLPPGVREGPREPELIAALHLWALPSVSRKWAAILDSDRMRVRVVGRFCHGGPFAQYHGMSKEKCELGDVLIVHMHTDSLGQEWNNALLLQAKMVNRYPHQIRGQADLDQFRLLDGWPLFQYVKSGRTLNGTVRDVVPKAAHAGAQYLGIDWRGEPSGPGSGVRCSLDVCPTRPRISPGTDFSVAVVDMMVGDQGRPFWRFGAPVQHGAWSQVIWDLIRKTASTNFHSSRVVRGELHRGFADEDIQNLDRSLPQASWMQYFGSQGVTLPEVPKPASNDGEDDEDGGPSVVIIRSSMSPERKED
jgi:hypothetical protein